MADKVFRESSDPIDGLRSSDQFGKLAALTILRNSNHLQEDERISVRLLLEDKDIPVKTEAIVLLGLKGNETDVALLRREVQLADEHYLGVSLVSLARLGDIEFVATQVNRLEFSGKPLFQYWIPEIKRAIKKAKRSKAAIPDNNAAQFLSRFNWEFRDIEVWKGSLLDADGNSMIRVTVYGPVNSNMLSEQHLKSIVFLNSISSDDLWAEARNRISERNFRSDVTSYSLLTDYRLDEIVFPHPYIKAGTVLVLRLVCLSDDGDDLELFWIDDDCIAFADQLIADDPGWFNIVV